MTAGPKPCILCGAPRAPYAKRYCTDCRDRMALKLKEAENRRKREQRGERAAAAKKKSTEDLEAAERARSTNGWIRADIVECKGCIWWRALNHSRHWMACHYGMDTPFCRNIAPEDCYKHEGTPYRPKGG